MRLARSIRRNSTTRCSPRSISVSTSPSETGIRRAESSDTRLSKRNRSASKRSTRARRVRSNTSPAMTSASRRTRSPTTSHRVLTHPDTSTPPAVDAIGCARSAAYAGWTHVPPRISAPRPPSRAQRIASKSHGSTGPGTRMERRSRSKPAVIPSHIAHGPRSHKRDAGLRMDQEGPLRIPAPAPRRLPRKNTLEVRTKVGMTAALVVELDIHGRAPGGSSGSCTHASCSAPPRSLARHARSLASPCALR
jgi:hypothetical protein